METSRLRELLGYAARNFVRGLAITAPVAFTLYIAYRAIAGVDGWLGLRIPGAGLLIVVGSVTLIGSLATNVVTRATLATLDQIMERLPFVRLLYTAAKDLMHAFVGEKRRFTRAVRVQADPSADVWSLGFITSDELDRLGLPGHVAVYLPFSYAFTGRLILLPAERVVPVHGDSGDMMAFIVSGGVAGRDRTVRP
ncbi:MAG: DUF502 domain-containing protein [Gemmatimonadota bacterium]